MFHNVYACWLLLSRRSAQARARAVQGVGRESVRQPAAGTQPDQRASLQQLLKQAGKHHSGCRQVLATWSTSQHAAAASLTRRSHVCIASRPLWHGAGTVCMLANTI